MNIRTAHIARAIARVALVAAVVVGPVTSAFADERVTATITNRLANGFIMQTFEGTVVTVTLTDLTKIKVDNGPGRWEAADLIPGLRVTVEGTYDSEMALMASEIKFSKSDRKLALAIRAGLTPTAQQVAKNTTEIEQHGGRLDQHNQTLGAHQQQLVDHGEKIVATTGAIVATNERIGRLDDYNVIDSFTVYFKNGRAAIGKEYLPQLTEFANKAKGIAGGKVLVSGHASAVGAPALNDALSLKRAEAVTMALQQSGAIAPADLLVPEAMGTKEQVAENATKKGQAQNRRVVVTILQNKGIAEK